MATTQVTAGYIPNKVCYISKPTTKITRENILRESETEEVTPTFVTDPENKKTLETGRNWAKTGGYSYNQETKRYTQELHTPTEEIQDNAPMKGVRIFSLEVRGEGGRAYKAILPKGYYVDLREDVLVDTMLHAGITKQGILNGEYIWARVGSEMKLIRVGSALHDLMINSTLIKTKKEIPKGQLIIGAAYRTKQNNIFVYLGELQRVTLVQLDNYHKSEREQALLNKMQIESQYNLIRDNYTYNYVIHIPPKQQMWLEVYQRDWDKLEANNLTLEGLFDDYVSLSLDFVKEKAVLEHITTFSTFDFLLEIRNKTLERKRHQIAKDKADKAKRATTHPNDRFGSTPVNEFEYLWYYCDRMTVCPVGVDPVQYVPQELSKYFIKKQL